MKKIVKDWDGCVCKNPDCKIPYGYCHCGCRGKTRIPIQSFSSKGWFAGVPIPFITGHHGRKHPEIINAKPFKIDGVYCRLIPLTHGMYAIVWESDYKYLMQWKWWARKHTNGYYPLRVTKPDGVRIVIRMQNLLIRVANGKEVDHANGCSLDNRRSNLRVANRYQQAQNRCKPSNNTSGYKGVKLSGASYIVNIGFNGQKIYVGRFHDLIEAARAYDRKAIELHGKFARTNFPLSDYGL